MMPGLISWLRRIFGLRKEEQPVSQPPAPPPQPVSPPAPQAERPKEEMAALVAEAQAPAPEGLPAEVGEAVKAAAQPPEAGEIIERRVRQASEALLDNESLTADLEDSAAQALLAWGLALVRHAAAETAGMDDEQAEAEMAPRLRAIRQMLRAINNWVGRQAEEEPEADQQALQKIIEHAQAIYGARFNVLSGEQAQLILQEIAAASRQPGAWIDSLRRSLEPHD